VSDNRHFILAHPTARKLAAAQCMLAPIGYHCRIEPPTRNLEQNAKLHAVLTDIAEQVEWFGKKLPMEVWKRLCMAAWLRERGEQPTLIPALDGNGFDVIFEKTSKLSVSQCSELVEWCLAFAAEHGVVFDEQVMA
jgi:NinB protein